MAEVKPLSFAPPEGAKKKEKKKHVLTENEERGALTIIGALMGGHSVPEKYLKEADISDLVLKKAAKPLRVNILSFGHPEIHYSELFGIQWGWASNLPLIKTTTIWQMEKGLPLRVAPDDYGIFCTEDVYLVLSPGLGEGENFELFLWVGNKSSPTKRAYGAIRASQLNLCFSGHTSLRHEAEGEESEMFLGLFDGTVNIAEGPGTEDGSRHVPEAKEQVPRLYRLREVSPKEDPHVRLVEASSSCLSKRDAFVLAARGRVFAWWWRPEGPSLHLVSSAIAFAHAIRTETKSFSENVLTPLHPDFDEFWDVLGVNLPCHADDLEAIVRDAEVGRALLRTKYAAAEEAEDEDALAELPQEDGVDSTSHGVLFTMRRKKDGKPELVQIKDEESRVQRSMLSSDHSYILDCDSEVFVWKGHKSDALERRLITKTARSLFEQYDRPPGSQLRLVSECGEPVSFRARVSDWRTSLAPKLPVAAIKKNKVGPSVGIRAAMQTAIAPVVQNMMETPPLAEVATEKFYDIDYTKKDFSVTDVWMMVSLDPRFVKLPEAQKGIFYSGNCYMVLNRTWDDEYEMWVHNIYFWQGRDCNNMWFASCLLGFIPSLRKRLLAGGRCRRNEIRIYQQKEPEEFMNLFNNLIVIHRGQYGDEDRADTSLYHVYMREHDLRAVEVDQRGDILDTKDSYLLQLPDVQYLWLGRQCPPIARVAAMEAAWRIEGNRSSVVFFEGVQNVDFWDRLGGFRKSLYYGANGPRALKKLPHPRVWRIGSSGGAELLSLHNACGLDLDSSSVQIIDLWSTLYVRIGADTTPRAATRALCIAEQYARGLSIERSAKVVVERIEPGDEPFLLQKLFDFQMPTLFSGKKDPRISYLRRRHRCPITGRKLAITEKDQEEEDDEDEDEDDEDEEEEEEELQIKQELKTYDIKYRIDWEKANNNISSSMPTSVSDGAQQQIPSHLNPDAKASLVWESRVVGQMIKPAAKKKKRIPQGDEEEEEDQDDDVSSWLPLPVYPKIPVAQTAVVTSVEEEKEAEGGARIVHCDYCGDEGPFKTLRSTPLLKDRKIEVNGICRNCWVQLAPSLAWPESRMAQVRAEKAAALATKSAPKPSQTVIPKQDSPATEQGPKNVAQSTQPAASDDSDARVVVEQPHDVVEAKPETKDTPKEEKHKSKSKEGKPKEEAKTKEGKDDSEKEKKRKKEKENDERKTKKDKSDEDKDKHKADKDVKEESKKKKESDDGEVEKKKKSKDKEREKERDKEKEKEKERDDEKKHRKHKKDSEDGTSDEKKEKEKEKRSKEKDKSKEKKGPEDADENEKRSKEREKDKDKEKKRSSKKKEEDAGSKK